ncbi:uncharacterized protein J4E78_007299 [Alternaria triticimaculans]|uniref:uncharacterized protein n=1 Tax=Alternaria triticimaculans TaxID=297637 RepID=UPI0020C3ADF0|nr:uncharacterized protein J4E78_007299 [Alternaria triticimaculans]KAI4654254.1 hypothetical protein J4E78_007299 [Alternaria triticimaculans]
MPRSDLTQFDAIDFDVQLNNPALAHVECDLPYENMAKRKPRGNGGSGQDGKQEKGGKKNGTGKADEAPRAAEIRNKYMPHLVLVTTEPGKKKKLHETWESIKKSLESWQELTAKAKDWEKDHAAYYEFEAIEAEYNAKFQAHRDALDLEEQQTGHRRGHLQQTKDAKKAMALAQQAYKNVKKDKDKKRFDRVERRQNHDWTTTAQQVLEDWLFYQEASNRRRRGRYLDPDERMLAEAERLQRKLTYKLETGGTDGGYYDWLHSLLELYDSRAIGGQSYRQGFEDHLGNQIRDMRNSAGAIPRVGPGELRLWTPMYRRRLVGLRRSGEDDADSDIPDEIPHRFELDEAAIETERAKVDSKIDSETENLLYTSHEERRQDEVTQYKNDRPNTSNVREVTTSSGTIIEDRWGQIRTEQGLFISARESSWDWLTSYDLLGPVKSGWHPETSAVRDDPEDLVYPESGSERGSQVDAPQASGDQPTGEPSRDPIGTRAENGEAGIEEGQLRLRKEKNGRGKGTSKPGSASQSSGKASAGGEPTNDATILEKPVGESRKAGKATINYPYPAREFWRDSKPFQLGERKFVTTEWAEETTGRRERHTYRKLQHASPVNSPPQSPVLEEISDATIPMGFPETDTRAVALEPRSRRKICLLNPKRCRAFWPHSLNECWIPYSERPTRPEEPVKWPIQGIDAPKDVIEGGPDGYVPALGIPVYRSRLYDHYGLMSQSTPKDDAPARPIWPRIGIRVPYEPMTFEDLRLCREDGGKGEMEPEASKSAEPVEVPETSNQGKIGKILAPDAHLRGVHEVRSMAVPIIEEPQRPWADPEEEPDENDSGSGSDTDAESDDEGDLFHESYVTGSFPGGLPAPVSPPTEASETAAPEETAPASVAPEAAVPTEDDQMDNGAEDL